MGGRGATDSYYSHKNFAIYPLTSGEDSIAANLLANVAALDTATKWLDVFGAVYPNIPDSVMWYVQSEVACNLIDVESTNTVPLTISSPSSPQFLTDLSKVHVSAAAKIVLEW